jgi:iron complex outermembrane receptor protein
MWLANFLTKTPGTAAITVADLLSDYKVNDRIRLNLDVKNLTDKDCEEEAFGNVYAYPGAPRTVQFGGSLTF